MSRPSGSLSHTKLARMLLICGVIAAAMYMAADLWATALYPGYSIVARQESELSAIGAPTRKYWLAMTAAYTPLMIAFGLGVWLSAGSALSLRVAGGLLIAFPIVGVVWVLFAPMHQIGQARSLTDIIHLAFAGVQLVVMLLYMSFGAALGPHFRRFSIAMIVAMLAAGGFVGTQAQAIGAGGGPAWAGVVERVSVFAPMVWIIAFGIALLRRTQERAVIRGSYR